MTSKLTEARVWNTSLKNLQFKIELGFYNTVIYVSMSITLNLISPIKGS